MKELTKRKNYGPLGRFENIYDIFSKDVDDLFHFFGLSTLGSIECCNYIAPAEIIEKKDLYLINVELPGIDKKDVKISLNDNQTLIISGKKEETKVDENETSYFSEFVSGTFHREFKLPEKADKENVQAVSNNGILSISILKKKEIEKPKIKTIEIK
jgi:HSP20 family protein